MEGFERGEQVLCLGTRCSRFAVESSVAGRDRESEHATKPGGRGRWHCRSEVLPRYLPKSPPTPDSRGPQVEIFLVRFNSGHLSTFKSLRLGSTQSSFTSVSLGPSR